MLNVVSEQKNEEKIFIVIEFIKAFYMNRKKFIEKTALLAATSLVPISNFSMLAKSKYKLGLQLYTIDNDMVIDPISSLKSVKSMGYEDFEVFGFNAEEETFYGYKCSEFRKVLNDLEITASSGHFGFSPYLNSSVDELKRFVDQCISGANALKMKYITWPWLAQEQRTIDNFKLMSEKLNIIGEQVTAADIGFAYHNHGFEFEDQNGQNGFDIILNETDPSLVKLQMDMYWVIRSSKSTPKELVSNQPGRYVMWHIKDMDAKTLDYTELGNGSINYRKILPDPSESGLEFYYLEQGGNFAFSPLRSVADSADYFKKNLSQYL